jgi:methionyl-tRNA formyltransferase
MLSKELSPVDWNRSAHEIHCQIRGLIPWPCATTDLIHGETMKLYGAAETGETTSAKSGTIVSAGKQGIDVACGDGKVLRLTELQPPGGKRMAAAAYLLGHPIQL